MFQHIDSTKALREALQKIAGALKPQTSVALLHIDTQMRTLPYRLRFLGPDPLLPRFWRPSIPRIRRPPRQVRRMLAAAGVTGPV